MFIKIHRKSPSYRNPNIKPEFLGTLRVAWHRCRSHLSKASRLFTGPLALLAIIACDGTGAATAASAASVCPGSVSLDWSIIGASGQSLTCAQAGATSVALRLQTRTGGTPVFTAFPCANSLGIANVAPGLYDVAIELHDAKGAKLATSPPQASVAVAVGRTKVLTPVTFAVGSGGGGGGSRVALSLEAEKVASNCQGSSSGGAGITGTTIFIARSDGGCAPARLVRSLGGVEIGTYQVNCSSPEIASCVERDETLTTTGLRPDSYTLRVGGKIGPADCWVAESRIDVPATGQLDTRLILRRQSAPGC